MIPNEFPQAVAVASACSVALRQAAAGVVFKTRCGLVVHTGDREREPPLEVLQG
jgi:hypothetical protein